MSIVVVILIAVAALLALVAALGRLASIRAVPGGGAADYEVEPFRSHAEASRHDEDEAA